MKKNKNKYLLWTIFLLCVGITNAQTEQVVAASGKELTGSNGQVSYTVGEPAITTLISAGNLITQGYQQSNISVTSVKDIAAPEYQVTVYPNPTSAQLTIYIQGLDQEAFFKVYDISGKLIEESNTSSEKSQLDFSRYAAGEYMLQLIDNKGVPFSHQQIIKTN